MTTVAVSTYTNGLVDAVRERDPSLTAEDIIKNAMELHVGEVAEQATA